MSAHSHLRQLEQELSVFEQVWNRLLATGWGYVLPLVLEAGRRDWLIKDAEEKMVWIGVWPIPRTPALHVWDEVPRC